MDDLESIQQQIQNLQNKADELKKSQKAAVVEEIKKQIKLYGINAKDLGLSIKDNSSDGKKVSTVEIKYKHGDNTWTGRGRMPKWMEEKVSAGAKKEDFLVK